ncbi:unnamed protein product [Peronospora belbahrii]|uniref:Mid2 domain-containing protein n=1 Tax=Peronospora belbahrii TaxID=622444 RepID=A0AAU9KH04_9STRA|nr:unnamed protein product [Peronospora belbahrii]CAH0515270.1 unnamed protein product [Peronospora belbahrii]
MRFACILLLFALVIAADAHMAATLETLSPPFGSTKTQENPVSTDTLINTVLKSAVLDSVDNEILTTSAPKGSRGQDAITLPAHDSATTRSDSVSNSSRNDSAAQTGYKTPSAAATDGHKPVSSTVDALNERTGKLSAGTSTGVEAILPIILGALGCVGVLAMAVMHQKKRDVNVNDSNRASLDCEYSGTDLLPEDQSLSIAQAKSPLVASKMPDSDHNLAVTACIVGNNSPIHSTSPFGSTRKMRVSSPVPSSYPNRETNIEFQDACSRYGEGSDVILTFNKVRADSSYLASQVQL